VLGLCVVFGLLPGPGTSIGLGWARPVSP